MKAESGREVDLYAPTHSRFSESLHTVGIKAPTQAKR